MAQYPGGVPSKFDPDGNVQTFIGNSIICPLSKSSPLYGWLRTVHERLKKHSLRSTYALLPLSTSHMTLFICARDQIRNKRDGYWPKDLDVAVPQSEAVDFLTKRLEVFNLQCQPPYQMHVAGFREFKRTISVHLVPRDDAENERMRNLRDRLSEATGIRHPGHDGYSFHVTLAYMLRFLTAEETAEMNEFLQEQLETMPTECEFGPPEFSTFENMYAFTEVLTLKDQEDH